MSYSCFKFNTLEVAERFHQNMVDYGKHAIILGDDNRFWIVTNRQALKLLKIGYELA